MALKVARRGSIPPFIVMDVMRAANERAAAGQDVLHLEVGQPGTSAPAGVLEAAAAALGDDRIGYTDAFGIPPLRQRIARHYRDAHGLELASDRVAVTTGSSGGFLLGFLAAFDAGAVEGCGDSESSELVGSERDQSSIEPTNWCASP